MLGKKVGRKRSCKQERVLGKKVGKKGSCKERGVRGEDRLKEKL